MWQPCCQMLNKCLRTLLWIWVEWNCPSTTLSCSFCLFVVTSFSFFTFLSISELFQSLLFVILNFIQSFYQKILIFLSLFSPFTFSIKLFFFLCFLHPQTGAEQFVTCLTSIQLSLFCCKPTAKRKENTFCLPKYKNNR